MAVPMAGADAARRPMIESAMTRPWRLAVWARAMWAGAPSMAPVLTAASPAAQIAGSLVRWSGQ